jgi:hypothetical protein
MPERRFRPPGNPVLRHVLKIELRIPLIELLCGSFPRSSDRKDCGSSFLPFRIRIRLPPEPASTALAPGKYLEECNGLRDTQ